MKKVLLSMVALLMSTFTFAQVNGALKLDRNTAPAKVAVKASPRKALADGQRISVIIHQTITVSLVWVSLI